LLNRGASVNIADEYGFTTLYVTARVGHINAGREFLNHVANA